MINVLVTGANGFVGCELCYALHASGYKVRGTVRSLDDTNKTLDIIPVGNIGPETCWMEALRGVDVVVHLAARVHVMNDKMTDSLAAFRQVNTLGTARLASLAAKQGIKRFVYISSIKVNGEGGGKILSENDEPAPKDPYAISKWEAEQQLQRISSETGMEIVIVRPPLVYGPGVKANFLSLVRWVDTGLPLPLGAVKNKRSLVAVKNLVDFLVKCVEHPNAAGEIFMVADGDDVSTPELLRRVAQGVGKKARLLNVSPALLCFVFGLIKRRDIIERLCSSLRIDISKAKRQLGWIPPVSLRQGISEVTQWYLQEKEGRNA